MRSSCSFHNQKLSAESCLPTLSVNFRVGHDAELSLPTFTRVSSLRFTSLLHPQEITSFLAYPHLLQGLQCVHFHVPNRIWEKEISQPPEDFCPFWTVSGVYCPLWDVKVIHQTLNYKVFTVFFCWKLWDKTEFVSLASKTLWSSRDQIQDDYKEIKKNIDNVHTATCVHAPVLSAPFSVWPRFWSMSCPPENLHGYSTSGLLALPMPLEQFVSKC